ncbi:HD family phosphohydrolase [Litoribrevibacter albus]|uniref:HD family phosphohydrolase n=1 Tax=Litoribrevibacter albus TaxID=1473156 RepID=A0AA37S912_9GAMM|nr:HD family phosphohydrolase [Litoribrevibacter albus]
MPSENDLLYLKDIWLKYNKNMSDHQGSYRGCELIEVKLNTAQLEIGMYVKELDRPWLQTPFMFQGFRITTERELQQLRALCKHVTIEVEKHYWFSYQKHHINEKTQESSLKEPQVTTPLHKTLPEAKTLYDKANVEIHSILNKVKEAEDIDIEPIRETINGFVRSVVSNPNALLWLTRIKNRDEYTAEHCLRVAILSIAFGRHLDLDESELSLLGMCGMLHDVGKMIIPDEILNKPGKLTPEEYDVMKAHASRGGELLEQQSDLDPSIITVARHHHERLDGMGYPSNLKAENISLYTRIVTIVDAYDAISSERCYKPAATPAEALRILYENRGTQFDPELLQHFILMVGIVPTGSIVELNNGQVGIVLANNPQYKLKPKVLLVRDEQKRPQEERIINLAKCPIKADEKPLEISKALSNGSFGVDILDYTKSKEYPHLSEFNWL